ncbi:leucine efflux protein LeuE [Streptomyces sp. WAC06614]|uniref:leucine efflux protein LeuE n=1 Tax=Streptomyces sp. WAC06614 TaxID=2487416 RepID=UPI000F76F5FD|nr:leucine efflux protein LeuE [Streptomyces sp. WAC06614]RSS83947.1 leucine efflux protein LeuE [Streptomyces sp. WAC06614]
MLGVTDLPTYLAALALIILLPGPNSLYVLSVASRRGVRDGYRAACGVFTGDTVLMALTALGAGALLQASPLVFGAVKVAGAGYLAWIALGMMRTARGMWRSRDAGAPAGAGAAVAGAVERAGAEAAGAVAGAGGAGGAKAGAVERPYRRALVVSLLNPKAILFLLSFFVQFVDPAYAYPALSFLLLGSLAQLSSFLYLSTLIFSGARLSAAFRRRRRLTAGLSSAAGVLFLGFAAKLATS